MYNRSHQLICQTYIYDVPLLKERAKLNLLKMLPNPDIRDWLRYGLVSLGDVEFLSPEIAIGKFDLFTVRKLLLNGKSF